MSIETIRERWEKANGASWGHYNVEPLLADIAALLAVAQAAIHCLCDHDWDPFPTMDMAPPIEGQGCSKCGFCQSRQDHLFSDGEWHPTAMEALGAALDALP